jgi:acyl-CoA synthetase (AMP-forming)/AMP-acid ligase II
MMLKLSTRDQTHTLLDTLAAHDDAQTAIVYLQSDHEPLSITRAQFRNQVTCYAAALQSLGIRPGDVVVIAHVQSLESIYAFWGAMLIGAIPSMFPTLTEKLDPNIYMHGMTTLVKLSNVRAVLTTETFAPVLAQNLDCAVYSSSQLQTAVSESFTPHSAAAKDIALLQHSSGTTGLQKGVALSHRAILNQIASYSDAIALTQHDVIVSWLPLYHDMGLIAGFLLPLMQGVPLVLMSPFDWVAHPAMLFRAIHTYGGTLCWMPNFAYNHCARRIRQRDLDGLSAARMRLFINCSEPVHAESHRLFAERFAQHGVTTDKLAVSYAMAENTFAVTQTTPGQPAHVDWVQRDALQQQRRALPALPETGGAAAYVSCGKPIDGTEVTVIDAAGSLLPERTVGELSVRSHCMLTGYYRRPDIDPFHNGWYRTGDMGYLAEGEIYVIGRSKDLIIHAGKNVYPQDIEAIVNGVPGVHAGRAVAFGVPDAREGTELIAVVAEVNVDSADEQHRITQSIRQRVVQESGVTVRYVHLVRSGWLIKTSSGKIARAANREQWLAERAQQGGSDDH